MKKSPGKWLVHSLMLLCALLVSTSFTVGKAIAPDLDPAIITLIRFFMASVLFLPIVHLQHGLSVPPLIRLLGYSVISGALVAFFYLMFLSLRYTTALHTGVIFTLVPSISGLYSWIILRETLGKTRVIALIPAMFGALWVIFEGHPQLLFTLSFNQGDLIFFMGCLFMGLYTPLVRLFHKGEPMTEMTVWILVSGFGWLLLLTGYKLFFLSWGDVPGTVWAGIAYLAIFTTIITFFISQWATLHLGPTRVMAYSYLYPPLIILIEWVLGKGLPSGKTLAGILFLVPAMYFVQRGAIEYRKKKAT